jgi:allantoicase
MFALLGNGKGKVKPWYLPFDWCFCMVNVEGYVKVYIVKNSRMKNVYALPVDLVNGVVIGRWENQPHSTTPEQWSEMKPPTDRKEQADTEHRLRTPNWKKEILTIFEYFLIGIIIALLLLGAFGIPW